MKLKALRKDERPIREILDFAEERGMTRKDATHELLAWLVNGNETSYTARIRAIVKAMVEND